MVAAAVDFPPPFAEITPSPEAMERDRSSLLAGFRALGDRHLLTLRLSPPWGGQGLSQGAFFDYQLALARHSGTLAFLQTQHQTAAAFIAQGEQEALKTAYLPAMGEGKIGVGVGYSHLRRSEPALQALPLSEGYRLTGGIPWLTGWGIFEAVVIGATLPDGRLLFGLIPFETGGGLTLSEPLAMVAMASTQTVSGRFDDYLLGGDRLLAIHPPQWMAQKDRENVLKGTAFPLGIAGGALDLMGGCPGVEVLEGQWRDCWGAIRGGDVGDPHRLRGEVIALAGRCTLGAIAFARGAAIDPNHPAQRLYRELMIFTISGQTPLILGGILGAITEDNSTLTHIP
ncbi:acyl-CoA dehydrogenase family protein [Spirulina sp. CCNP1310]|uniref:acyl-CoA dehydrogenase family protein n=1 Tax=Spirulina sp. CCNP1310 TaxID=3110249 RepID=UPI002B206820|nr:acyl-CoA dehydrogenase family protein [Spirulina sp. CCNP1310]MEA5418684.1 acyl-CoA dehydrogenase family protein [Spirulina sp. CCNP1310]